MSLRSPTTLLPALILAGTVVPATETDDPGHCTTGPSAAPPTYQERGDVIDGTTCTLALPSSERFGAEAPRSEATSDPAWQLVSEQDVWQRLDVGERFAVWFDMSAEALTSLTPADPLTALARQAVDRSPDWLWTDLEDQFSRMSVSQQDTWAGMILDANDPYVDEVAFLVAHVSRDDLAHAWFDPGLIMDASTYAYEVDEFLDYVDVVDHGSAAAGGDYYTSLVYDLELDGTVSSVEYPPYYYYWYVLHPRGSDEQPAYIDPTKCSSEGDPAPPPTGKFWQRWLFYNADNKNGGICHGNVPCPILKEHLAGVPVLWKHNNDGNGAEHNGAQGAVNDWVRRSLSFTSETCRPVQPVQVHYHMIGRCGEWADLTMAAGRAALIPTEVTGARGNDHVWNEFYDHQWGRWVQWEPVNNMTNASYGGWWGGLLFTTNTYRGDGYCHSDLTSMHSETSTLTITAYDANHYPLEGAEVTLEYDFFSGILFMPLNTAYTNEKGEAVFTIGDGRDYYASVHTDWGDSGRYLVVQNSDPALDYFWSPPDFPGAVPRLDADPAGSPGSFDDYMVQSEVDVLHGYVHGGQGMLDLAHTQDEQGDIDTFVVDQENWDLFTTDASFDAFELTRDETGHQVSFVPPVAGDWYVAWSNKAAVNMSHVIRGAVHLYRNTGAVPPVEGLMVDKDGGESLLDWEDLVGQNVDYYNVYSSASAADVASGRDEAELAPYLLASPVASEYRDARAADPGSCLFYTVRTHSKRGGISP